MTSDKEVYFGRRAHSSVKFAHLMVMFGGFNDQGVMLDDVLCFNMRDHCWEHVQMMTHSRMLRFELYIHPPPYMKAVCLNGWAAM